jgi:cysteine-rich repeat protein
MTVRAATITLGSARIVALPIPDGPIAWGYASISLEATAGDLALQGSGLTTARIEGQGNWATDVSLMASGDVTIDGSILNRGTGADPYGGAVTVAAGGTIAVNRDLNTTGSGEIGGGGDISLDAGGDIHVNAVLDASGSASPGAISLSSSGGDLLVGGRVDSSASAGGAGGSLSFEAPAGQVAFGDRVLGNGSELGSGDDLSCGDGADVEVVAGGDVSLAEPVDVNGGQTCTGGAVDISAGTSFTMAPGVYIHARAGGLDSSGGSFALYSGLNATLRSMDLTGAGYGGAIDARAESALTVSETIDVRATAAGGLGGGATLTACELSVEVGGAIDTRGDGDDFAIELTASGAMTIAGTLRSSTENRLVYLALLPTTTGATIVPLPIVVNEPDLTPCLYLTTCGNSITQFDEACDDGNNVSCDGCANDCSRIDDVCGDGIRECDEQCDDGNVTSGDGCNADCTVPASSELLFPGSAATKGCQVEWKLFLAEPALDPITALPKRTQKCVDGDPGCDVDGLRSEVHLRRGAVPPGGRPAALDL